MRTYGEHLYDWFDSLEQSGLDWRDVDEATIAAYRNRMLEAPSPHRSPLRTLNDQRPGPLGVPLLRLGAQAEDDRRAAVQRPRCACGSAKGHGLSRHAAGKPSPISTLSITEYETLPRPLRVSDLHRLRAALDMPYRLMAEWAVTTGMRRMELCALRAKQIPRSEGCTG